MNTTYTRIPLFVNRLVAFVIFASLTGLLQAQTVDDGIMVAKRALFSGDVYSFDSWDHYWEGRLKRVNGNLGTVSTQTNNWYFDYGYSDRLNLIASIPYVWTHASQGVLHDQKGFQDITLAAKYKVIERPFTKAGTLRAFAVVSGGFPLTNYQPDFQPLSIGNQSKHVSGRFTMNFEARRGWYVNASSAFTWRDNVTIDAPYYYTNGQLFLTDDVEMPDVFDYIVAGGFVRRHLKLEGSFMQQRTQGGGEIRRQDAPFISNHVNFSKVGATVIYPVPKLHDLAVQFVFGHIGDGRNAGQSTSYSTGLLYTVHFPARPIKRQCRAPLPAFLPSPRSSVPPCFHWLQRPTTPTPATGK